MECPKCLKEMKEETTYTTDANGQWILVYVCEQDFERIEVETGEYYEDDGE